MTNLNDEFNDWKRNGKGNRTNDQVAILKAYEIAIQEVSSDNIFIVTDRFEQAYVELQ